MSKKKQANTADITAVIHSLNSHGVGRSDSMHVIIKAGVPVKVIAGAIIERYTAAYPGRTPVQVTLHHGKVMAILTHTITDAADQARLLKRCASSHWATFGEIPNLIFVEA